MMLPGPHDPAQLLADQAGSALASGDVQTAEELYTQAAQLESEVLLRIPPDRGRTFAIVGVSVASLWYRAANYARAEQVARELLSDSDLLPSARSELTDLLAAIPQSAAVAAGGGLITLRPTRRPERPSLYVIDQLKEVERSAAAERL